MKENIKFTSQLYKKDQIFTLETVTYRTLCCIAVWLMWGGGREKKKNFLVKVFEMH